MPLLLVTVVLQLHLLFQISQSQTTTFTLASYILTQNALDDAPQRYADFVQLALDWVNSQKMPDYPINQDHGCVTGDVYLSQGSHHVSLSTSVGHPLTVTITNYGFNVVAVVDFVVNTYVRLDIGYYVGWPIKGCLFTWLICNHVPATMKGRMTVSQPFTLLWTPANTQLAIKVNETKVAVAITDLDSGCGDWNSWMHIPIGDIIANGIEREMEQGMAKYAEQMAVQFQKVFNAPQVFEPYPGLKVSYKITTLVMVANKWGTVTANGTIYAQAPGSSAWTPFPVTDPTDANLAPPNTWPGLSANPDWQYFMNGMRLSSTILTAMVWAANIAGHLDPSYNVTMLDAMMQFSMHLNEPTLGIPANAVLQLYVPTGNMYGTCYNTHQSDGREHKSVVLSFFVTHLNGIGTVVLHADAEAGAGISIEIDTFETAAANITLIAPDLPFPASVTENVMRDLLNQSIPLINDYFSANALIAPPEFAQYLPDPTLTLFHQTGTHGYMQLYSMCSCKEKNALYMKCENLYCPKSSAKSSTETHTEMESESHSPINVSIMTATPVPTTQANKKSTNATKTEDATYIARVFNRYRRKGTYSHSNHLLQQQRGTNDANDNDTFIAPASQSYSIWMYTYSSQIQPSAKLNSKECNLMNVGDYVIVHALSDTEGQCKVFLPSIAKSATYYYSLRMNPSNNKVARIQLLCSFGCVACAFDSELMRTDIQYGHCYSFTDDAVLMLFEYETADEAVCLGGNRVDKHSTDVIWATYDTNTTYCQTALFGMENLGSILSQCESIFSADNDNSNLTDHSVVLRTKIQGSDNYLYDMSRQCDDQCQTCGQRYPQMTYDQCQYQTAWMYSHQILFARDLQLCGQELIEHPSPAISAQLLAIVLPCVLVMLSIALCVYVCARKHLWQDVFSNPLAAVLFCIQESGHACVEHCRRFCVVCTTNCWRNSKVFVHEHIYTPRSMVELVLKSKPKERLQSVFMFAATLAIALNFVVWHFQSPWEKFDKSSFESLGIPSDAVDSRSLEHFLNLWENFSEYAFYLLWFIACALLLLCRMTFAFKNKANDDIYWCKIRTFVLFIFCATQFIGLYLCFAIFYKFYDAVKLNPNNDNTMTSDKSTMDTCNAIIGYSFIGIFLSYFSNLVLFWLHSVPVGGYIISMLTIACMMSHTVFSKYFGGAFIVDNQHKKVAMMSRLLALTFILTGMTSCIESLPVIITYQSFGADMSWISMWITWWITPVLLLMHIWLVCNGYLNREWNAKNCQTQIYLNIVVYFALYLVTVCISIQSIDENTDLHFWFPLCSCLTTLIIVMVLWMHVIHLMLIDNDPIQPTVDIHASNNLIINQSPAAVAYSGATEEDAEEDEHKNETLLEYREEQPNRAILTINNNNNNDDLTQNMIERGDTSDHDHDHDDEANAKHEKQGFLRRFAVYCLSFYECCIGPCVPHCVERFCVIFCVWLFEKQEREQPYIFGHRTYLRRLFLILGTGFYGYVVIHSSFHVFGITAKKEFMDLLSNSGYDLQWPDNDNGGTILDDTFDTYNAARIHAWIASAIALLLFLLACVFGSINCQCCGRFKHYLSMSRICSWLSGGLLFTAILLPAIPNYVQTTPISEICPYCAPQFNNALYLLFGDIIGLFCSALFTLELLGMVIAIVPSLQRVAYLVLQDQHKKDYDLNYYEGYTLKYIYIVSATLVPLLTFLPLLMYQQTMGDNVIASLIIAFWILPVIASNMIFYGKRFKPFICYVTYMSLYFFTLLAMIVYHSIIYGLPKYITNQLLRGEIYCEIVAEYCLTNVILSDVLYCILLGFKKQQREPEADGDGDDNREDEAEAGSNNQHSTDDYQLHIDE